MNKPDFMLVSVKPAKKKDEIEVYPKFIIKKSKDLMIRGGDFYAIWLPDEGRWSTDEQDALRIIDSVVDEFFNENRDHFQADRIHVLHMWDAETGMIDRWHKYCQVQSRDNFHMLDETLEFVNSDTSKEDYSSKHLNYPLEPCDISAYDKLIGTLYEPEERHKIEWCIGSIVSGDSKFIQKFAVLYGAAGTGKSTVLNIIQKLFEGYTSVFDAKALGSSSNAFALEAFKTNPLVAIQHDGDLSKIEDNTRINSLVSHELMTVNEKFRSTYANRFKAFLFMGTNKPVRITDAKSGIIRRLIDISPSGNKLPQNEYQDCMSKIEFELGGIASHCQDIYLENPNFYNDYIPIAMMGASNDFYNFVEDSYLEFSESEGISLKAAWELYKHYVDDAKVAYPYSQRVFKEELKNYFEEYEDRTYIDGMRIRSYYKGFIKSKFDHGNHASVKPKPETLPDWLDLKQQNSLFDIACADCSAQYANHEGTPFERWDRVSRKLSSIDTSKLHYVKVPENHIVIDFDITDDDGNKSKKLNLEAASKWPPTYAELSKSGAGVHLHYIYNGDPLKLSRVYDDQIEIKVYSGKSSLRRMLTLCNDTEIATISSGLPLKGEKKMIDFKVVQDEKHLRAMIVRNLNKEFGSTKCSIDFIAKLLNEAYDAGVVYDVRDLYPAVKSFGAQSTNQSAKCLEIIHGMHFKSDIDPEYQLPTTDELVFFDCEVFPNLFVLNWKVRGEGKSVVRMINPDPEEVSRLFQFKLVGFNNRKYDNHILYARSLGYSNEQLFKLSQRIISSEKSDDKKNCFFSNAYNLSYTDIYDFAAKKQSLKKWEIELGIHHKELGLPWDKPVPEELWIKVAEYCDNDVLATEATFEHLQADFVAREMLADATGLSVNDTTNTLTTKFIFGDNKHPQSVFNYRDMGDVSQIADRSVVTEKLELYNEYGDEYTVFDKYGRPIFPGYKYEFGRSRYRDVDNVGEGGRVSAKPGMYIWVALLDIASMHPTSIIAENLFGEEYTKRFAEIKECRIAIKHHEFDRAKTMLGGVLAKYLEDESQATALAYALKIMINSVYGLTAAKFENAFRDPRNVDNIVAKRGALFMINLEHEVAQRGFTVAHIKTDSIKIPNATPEIIKFVMDYGNMYGYNFEHEATYERMCLVNDAVYIAKFATAEDCESMYGYIPDDCKKHGGEWTATGAQFQVPYVFKTLFTKEPIAFEDMCETKSVKTAIYLDFNEKSKNMDAEEKELAKLKRAPVVDMDKVRKLEEIIQASHNYSFVGKVGNFCPVKPGTNGGVLVREGTDKHGNTTYGSVTGTKGYRWMESEVVKLNGLESAIDRTYYDSLVDAALSTMEEYGDTTWFIEGDVNDIPPWFAPGELETADLFAVR